MELNEKDLHCIARMLQGFMYMDRWFWACEGNCQYAEECAKSFQEKHNTYFNTEVRNKLSEITGVYCGMLINRFEAEENVAAHELPHWKP